MPKDPRRPTSGEHLLPPERVETGRRLVEQHELGIADQGLGQLRTLAHAGGEPTDRAEPRFVQPDEIEDVGRPLAGGARRQSAQLTERRHHVRCCLVEREAVVFRHEPEP